MAPKFATVVLVLALVGCATGRAHENFKNMMARNVGRSADDPAVVFNYYKRYRGPSTPLANGNSEQSWIYGKCRVFFEVSKDTRKIVEWRYEGGPDDCAVVP